MYRDWDRARRRSGRNSGEEDGGVKVNGRQNAYRQIKKLLGLLAQFGKPCPECFRVGYTGRAAFCSPGYILIGANPFLPGSKNQWLVCPRCRGFGAVLNSEVFIRGAASPGYIQAIQATDCPT